MEDQNCTITQSLISTQNLAFNSDKNNITPNVMVMEVVKTESIEGGQFEATGSKLVVKRGRGRPRKNDGNEKLLSLTPPPPTSFLAQSPVSTEKRSRGRPRGSGKLQILASLGGFVAETAGGCFKTHVVTVNTGEDVVSKILSFFHKGPKAVCIISATGTVSSVIIRQPGAAGGVLRYEGRFEIISLSGSCTYTSGTGGANRKNGMLSISLAKPDGSIFGGGIESSLIAATPIQLVMGSFKQNIIKQNKRRDSLGSPDAPNVPSNPDAISAHLQVSNLMEGQPSCPSPTTGLLPATTPNGLPVDVIAATTSGVPVNVILEDLNANYAPVNGVSFN